MYLANRATFPTSRGSRYEMDDASPTMIYRALLHRPGDWKAKGGGGLDQQTEAMGAWTFAGSTA